MPYLPAKFEFAEREVVRFEGSAHLDDREAVFDLDVIEHAPANAVRHPDTGVGLRKHNVVSADALKDAAVLRGNGLGPDFGDAEVSEIARDEHGGLEFVADANNGGREVARAYLFERMRVREVRLDYGDALGPALHEARVAVNGEHLDVHGVERVCDRGAEAAEADHEHAARVGVVLSQ